MKLYSMTATFGKLENQTLTLEPGLNLIHAPNEWGKSTWCAFLVAMLYGIDTRVHSTRTVLADKDRYAPWSGSPMSGRMELHWQGKDITIERTTKGRIPLGQFRAYETVSGLDIPELNADNCGQQLLGVEKSVFLRAGFLRLSDLPVTLDEALRRRLNSLVTTGDESATADRLAQKLKDLKNRCRANRANGLLPQAQLEKDQLEAKLRELEDLLHEQESAASQQQELEDFRGRLENHLQALEYADSEAYSQKLNEAKAAWEAASKKAETLQAQCAGLPGEDISRNRLASLQALRQEQDALQAYPLPPEPEIPQIPEPYKGLSPEEARQQAETDVRVFCQADNEKDRRLPGILGLVLALAGIPMLLIPHWIGIVAGFAAIAAGLLCWQSNRAMRKRARNTADALAGKYAPLLPDQWVDAAENYAQAQLRYVRECDTCRLAREAHSQKLADWQQRMDDLTGGLTPTQQEMCWNEALEAHRALAQALQEQAQAQTLLQALQDSHKEVSKPEQPDELTYSREQTNRLLLECDFSLKQLHQKLGRCQGRIEILGQRSAMEQQLDAVNTRIARLEQTYAALTLAQDTLAEAAADLQRRFAPRISKRANALFGKLTGGRYDRLTLDEDLSLQAGTLEETTLHSAIWRSEGTVDQLYLALRLAVAEELTPEAPLILDDALVRFDEDRLKAALQILQEEAQYKQVLLFTCQGREGRVLSDS